MGASVGPLVDECSSALGEEINECRGQPYKILSFFSTTLFTDFLQNGLLLLYIPRS